MSRAAFRKTLKASIIASFVLLLLLLVAINLFIGNRAAPVMRGLVAISVAVLILAGVVLVIIDWRHPPPDE